jgi:hypothetical protein
MNTAMINSMVVILLILSTMPHSFGQEENEVLIADTMDNILLTYPSPIKSDDANHRRFKLKNYSNHVDNEEDILGAWVKVESINPTLNLLIKEDCPQGRYLGIAADYANVFDYYDSDGSSIDFMFNYELKNKRFRGVFTNSNAIMFEEKHRGKSFEFVIQYFDKKDVLILITADGQFITYKRRHL